MSALTARIDGDDVTEYCQLVRWRERLSRKGMGGIRAPSSVIDIEEGVSQLELYLDADLVHCGPVWYSQAEGNPDSSYIELTSWDHRVYLPKRLCKSTSDPGNLITPGDVILTEVEGPSIASQYLTNTLDYDGDLPLIVGTVDTGGPDLSGVPTAFPMDLERMYALLVSTGQLDLKLTPGLIADGGSTLNFLNGDSGSDLSGSVKFEYATGLFNAQVATFTVDMEQVINALWYLIGERVTEERWRGSITPTAPHPGGDWPVDLITRYWDSRYVLLYMQEIQVFDDKGDENDIRELFEERWANEAWVRAVPRTFATVRPQRGTAPAFRSGDLIHVGAGAIINGGFSGAQRVYEFELQADVDGVLDIVEILTSADQEGATGATE